MRRAISIVPAVLAVVGALVLVMSRPDTAVSGPNCLQRIDQRNYNCDVTDENGDVGTMTLDFGPGSSPEDLSVLINGEIPGSCACIKKGKKLEKGGRVRCVQNENISDGDNISEDTVDFDFGHSTITAKARTNGAKMRGQGVDDNGQSIIFQCREGEPPAP